MIPFELSYRPPTLLLYSSFYCSPVPLSPVFF
nr:MAG TPA: hypothetical protein [Caudoviricetes sp.]